MKYRCQICGSDDGTTVLDGIRDWEYGVAGTYRYMRCHQCDQIQLDPFPTIDDLKRAYPDSYPAYLKNVIREKGRLYAILARLHAWLSTLPIKPYVRQGGKVLDIGCGNGGFLRLLQGLGARELHGIDFNAHAVAIASSQGIHAFEGVFLDYPAAPDTFDMVVMNNYIEHVLDPIAELKKARVILKPGGLFFGTLPNFNGLDRVIAGRYWGGNHVPRHTFQFTDTQLRRHLEASGFSKIRIVHDINPGHVAISVQNWLQRHVADLRHNPRLRHGRMKGFNMLLLAMLPVNIVFSLWKRSGIITFYAEK